MRLEEKNKVDKLNSLRFAAYMCIFLLHTKSFLPMCWNEALPLPWLTYTPARAGVWIFFILSGYGIGFGFSQNKYELSKKGIIRYYVRRVAKILPVYWFYILVVAVFITPELLQPSFRHVSQMLSLLLFHYQEEFYSLEFGLAWYLTTLMRLYLVAPFIFMVLKRYVNGREKTYGAIGVITTAGLVFRCLMHYHVTTTGSDWGVEVYRPFYFNLDFFCVGMLHNNLRRPKIDTLPRKIFKFGVVCGYVLLVAFNAYIYYYGSYAGNEKYITIYCYVLPSVYIVMTSAYIVLFDCQKDYRRVAVSADAVKRNPLRIFDYFPKIQMAMYLFHATVLLCLQRGYSDEIYQTYVSILGLDGIRGEWWKSCLFTVLAFFVILVLSIVISWLFAGKPSKNTVNKIECAAVRFLEGAENTVLAVLSTLFPAEKDVH